MIDSEVQPSLNKEKRTRIVSAINKIEDAKSIVDSVLDEEKDGVDNMPPSLTARMEESIDSLEEAIDSLNEAVSSLNEAIS